MAVIVASRYHDISTGHRVCGHEGKCVHMHGHNYRIHFNCRAPKLDILGRVIDFSVIKERLCMWTECNWDHRFLLWEDDPWAPILQPLDPAGVVVVPFNPTAENMAQYLVEYVGPTQLRDTNVILASVKIEETRRCSASYLTSQGSSHVQSASDQAR